MHWAWSVILAVATLAGLWLAARHALGWLVAAAGELVWVAYAVVSRQWGFLALAAAFLIVYVRNYGVAKR